MPKKKKGARPRPRDSTEETPTMLDSQSQSQTLTLTLEEQPPTQPPEDQPEPTDPSKPEEAEPTVAETATATAAANASPSPPPLPRKPLRKIRKPVTEKQRAAAQQKRALLEASFHPLPFSPEKTLDFSAHEPLFRALNLCDFACADLDRVLRADLLADLIANYDPSNRRSFVCSFRISIDRPSLAKALGLPAKKDKGDSHQDLQDLFLKEESILAIENFMSSYILLEDEMCILPPEVVAAGQLVKEGQPNRVDWAGLMWVLVEKELLEAPKTGSCRYASHLQCLVKHQRPELFEKAEPMPPVLEPESSMEASLAEEEDDANDGGEMKMRNLEEFQDVGSEKPGPGLSLVVGENGDPMDGVEICKEAEEELWVNTGKNEGFEDSLRRCNSSEVRGVEFENLCKGEQESKEEEFSNLERLTSTDLLQAMETVRVSYSPQMNSLDPTSGEFLSTRVDGNKNMSLDPGPDGSLFFGNTGKRHIGDIDDEDDEMQQFHENNQQKRMRVGGLWEEQMPSDFDSYIEQVQCSMGKAKMLYAEKEQQCINSHLQLQYLNQMLEQKDQIMRSMEKTRAEEQQKWQQVICRYENELTAMAHLVLGYKKALRETQSKFAEYRKKWSQGDEPLYKDVGDTGGIVLSSRELERLRMEKLEEEYRAAEETILAFQNDWFTKLEQYSERAMMLHRRLVELEGEVKLIRERSDKGMDA